MVDGLSWGGRNQLWPYMTMAYIVMADIPITYIVMAYIVMA